LDTVSIFTIISGVTAIVTTFNDGAKLFQKWRKKRKGKKRVGAAELETSLSVCPSTLQLKYNNLLHQHGQAFAQGDETSRSSLQRVRMQLYENLVDSLRNSIESEIQYSIEPISLRRIAEAAKDKAIEIMVSFAQRLHIKGRIPTLFQNDKSWDAIPIHPDGRLEPDDRLLPQPLYESESGDIFPGVSNRRSQASPYGHMPRQSLAPLSSLTIDTRRSLGSIEANSRFSSSTSLALSPAYAPRSCSSYQLASPILSTISFSSNTSIKSTEQILQEDRDDVDARWAAIQSTSPFSSTPSQLSAFPAERPRISSAPVSSYASNLALPPRPRVASAYSASAIDELQSTTNFLRWNSDS